MQNLQMRFHSTVSNTKRFQWNPILQLQILSNLSDINTAFESSNAGQKILRIKQYLAKIKQLVTFESPISQLDAFQKINHLHSRRNYPNSERTTKHFTRKQHPTNSILLCPQPPGHKSTITAFLFPLMGLCPLPSPVPVISRHMPHPSDC